MKFDKLKYLERIRLSQDDVQCCDLNTLKMLHYSHLLNIPFENIDIHYGDRIILDTDKLFNKIVYNKRGGFCYELNGLFYRLLKEIGYNVKMISAMVYNNKEKILGPEFDHMALIVTIDDNQYLCDVGFGCNTAEPLEFVTDIIQHDREGEFVINRYNDKYYVVRKLDEKPLDLYLFTESERQLDEFTEMCNYHQSSPESHFTRKKICSQLTTDGMKTISDNKLIITSKGIRNETPVNSEEEFLKLLKEHFNITILENKIITGKLVIETERTRICRFTANDADELSMLLSDTDVMKFYPKPLNRDETCDFLDRILGEYSDKRPSFWKVILKENNKFAGQAGVLYRKVEEEWVYMLGYMIMKECWGKGIALEISKGILEYCDDKLHITNIITLIRPENLQSIRVAEKLGLIYKKQVEYFGFVHNYYVRLV